MRFRVLIDGQPPGARSLRPGGGLDREGLAVLPYQILPHYLSDHPESEAMDAVLQRWLQEHVLFLALRDGEAIVVDGEKQMVVG